MATKRAVVVVDTETNGFSGTLLQVAYQPLIVSKDDGGDVSITRGPMREFFVQGLNDGESLCAFHQEREGGIREADVRGKDAKTTVEALTELAGVLRDRDTIFVAHNASFDLRVLRREAERVGWTRDEAAVFQKDVRSYCTMRSSAAMCGLRTAPNPAGITRLKPPRLEELAAHLGVRIPEGAVLHTAEADVSLTVDCFFRLMTEKKNDAFFDA